MFMYMHARKIPARARLPYCNTTRNVRCAPLPELDATSYSWQYVHALCRPQRCGTCRLLLEVMYR